MSSSTNEQNKPNKQTSSSLIWKKNLAVKKVLDTLVTILKEEYIRSIKENPDIFSK